MAPPLPIPVFLFFFNDTATTEIYTLSLHDALPIYDYINLNLCGTLDGIAKIKGGRSEEHTSELQSLTNLVCRLLLEKKKPHSKLRPDLLVSAQPSRAFAPPRLA